MTVFTDTWDAAFETTPANSDLLSEGAERIRELKVAVSERVAVDHSWDGDADDGEHTKVTFTDPLGADPGNVANKGFLYTKDIGGVVELFWEDESGNVIQLTTVGAIDYDVVDDTTPQLGGDLDLNGNAIDFPTTANIADCLDEDDMSSDSAVAVATQQSIKAYADSLTSGIVLQAVHTTDTGLSTTTTDIPDDNTIPQNTEGKEFMTLAITPTSATSRIVIEAELHLSSDAGGSGTAMIAAIFQDATANALATGKVSEGAGTDGVSVRVVHEMAAGTTSETTFKARGGANNGAHTCSFNGDNENARFGGTLMSFMRITEYAV